jgi:pimeloyl-ACP methyl ester carboxylesterase
MCGYLDPDLRPLAHGRTLVFFDQRGAGKSQLVFDPAQLTIQKHVADVEAVRQHFGIGRLQLIGHSWGAMVAAFYAAAHPQTTDRMESSRALVARFPERDEYVLSSSEFQRVKARLMRLSNSRVSTTGDIGRGDEGDVPGRPTLKRRQPTADDPSSTSTDGQKPAEVRDEPPQLKRRSEPAPATTTPQPTSSPNP